jgi:excisionase family DNA binding protein
MVEEAYVPIEDMAKHFAVSVSTARAWIRQGLVPALKVGGVYRFKLSEVEDALRNIRGDEVEEEPVELGTQLEFDFNPDIDL